jgi:starch phosphorylase
MLQANPHLARLLNERISKGWITDLSQLERLLPLADDPEFRRQFRQVKLDSKKKLAGVIKELVGVQVDEKSIFDIQIKRIHEYKRQHLNALYVLSLYLQLKRQPDRSIPARTFIFAGKAAPGYHQAKLIIRFITAIADLVNSDPEVSGQLKVVFLPNYCVSLGQDLFPAADVSEQISLAGKEASGTGNMKFGLNGAVTIGTLDGANVEMLEAVGKKNIVIFGLNAEEVSALRPHYNPFHWYETDPRIRETFDFIKSGRVAPHEPGWFEPFVNGLLHHDPFMVLADFAAYADAHQKILEMYRDEDRWIQMSIANTARLGIFSSDRTIREYAEDIWGLKPLTVSLS